MDSDYAQWAAVVVDFNVTAASAMNAITFSYGGGDNLISLPASAVRIFKIDEL